MWGSAGRLILHPKGCLSCARLAPLKGLLPLNLRFLSSALLTPALRGAATFPLERTRAARRETGE